MNLSMLLDFGVRSVPGLIRDDPIQADCFHDLDYRLTYDVGPIRFWKICNGANAWSNADIEAVLKPGSCGLVGLTEGDVHGGRILTVVLILFLCGYRINV
ncbi:hypothetical protein AKJ16_DCAP08937 [Drosera capensis]